MKPMRLNHKQTARAARLAWLACGVATLSALLTAVHAPGQAVPAGVGVPAAPVGALTPVDKIQLKRFAESGQPFTTINAGMKTYMLAVDGDNINYTINQGGTVAAQGQIAIDELLTPAATPGAPGAAPAPAIGAAEGGTVQELAAWRYERIESPELGSYVERVKYTADELKAVEDADLAFLETVFMNYAPAAPGAVPGVAGGIQPGVVPYGDASGLPPIDGSAPATAGTGYYGQFPTPTAGAPGEMPTFASASPREYAQWYYFYSQLKLWEEYVQRILRTQFPTMVPPDLNKIVETYDNLPTAVEQVRANIAKEELQAMLDLYTRLDDRAAARETYTEFQRERMIDIARFAQEWIKRQQEDVVQIDGVTYIPSAEPMRYVPRDSVNVVTKVITPYDLMDETGELKKPQGYGDKRLESK